MTPARIRSRTGSRAIGLLLAVAHFSMIASSPSLRAQPGRDSIYERFEAASSLRSQGKYGDAAELLRGIITEFAQSDEILRRAYSDLVFTLLTMQDERGAEEAARQGLDRYPDITADPIFFPPRVSELYDDLRNQMYGALNVVSRPESCRVLLGDGFVGTAPLNIQYVRVGEYLLKASKPGYKSETSTVSIEPGSPTSVQLALQRERNKRWWLFRIGPAAIAAGILAYVGLRGEDQGSEPQPLAGPPAPPTQ